MLTQAPDTGKPGERLTALSFGFGTRTEYERVASIDQVFALRVLANPQAVAVVTAEREITYAELESDANRVANHLIRHGVRPGASVGVALDRSPDLPAVLLGILKAGAAYVPLDPAYPRERVAAMIADAAVEVVIDESGVSTAKTGSDERPAISAGGAASLAYVTYTSGSTGRPKGVAIEHRGVVRLVRNTDYIDLTPADTVLHYAPLAFDASTFEIWGPLLNGARLAIPPPGLQAMDELAATVNRFGVTALFLTSALFARFVDAPGPRPPFLRCLITGGEVLSVSHARRFLDSFPACRLVNAYGPTENTTFTTMYPISRPDVSLASIPIGRPIANSSAHVLDAALRPVPVGEVGELCVGGDGVARGYLNQPDLSAERFVADPFAEDPAARLYRTGDLARFRADGALEFLGRTDGQVKIRGHRVETGEIETALRAHPAVREAAVVVAVRNDEKDLVAHVSVKRRVEEAELRAHLTRTLPHYMLPHRIAIHDDLPLNASGKVDRTALGCEPLPPSRTAPAGIPRLSGDPKVRARERAVAEIWHEVLGPGQEPGLDENFFDVGGDSLRLLTVHARLSERFNVKIKATDLFEHTTIRKLAAFLAQREAGA